MNYRGLGVAVAALVLAGAMQQTANAQKTIPPQVKNAVTTAVKNALKPNPPPSNVPASLNGTYKLDGVTQTAPFSFKATDVGAGVEYKRGTFTINGKQNFGQISVDPVTAGRFNFYWELPASKFRGGTGYLNQVNATTFTGAIYFYDHAGNKTYSGTISIP